MTHVRYILIMEARLALARAVTIAIRYAAIRRQGRDRDVLDQSNGKFSSASQEITVIDYNTVRIRLFPLLATTYALHYSGKATARVYLEHRRNVDQEGDFSLMSELHLTTSALKSMCTELAADGIEKCRRAMGGHGFGGPSGFINLNNDYLSRPTVEGDNWMITQQVARGLIKIAKATLENPETQDFSRGSVAERILERKGCTRTARNAERRQWYRPSLCETCRSSGKCHSGICGWFLSGIAKIFKAYEAREVQKRPCNSLLVQFHQLSRGSPSPPRPWP
jgi:acyl-CoA oxidase